MLRWILTLLLPSLVLSLSIDQRLLREPDFRSLTDLALPWLGDASNTEIPPAEKQEAAQKIAIIGSGIVGASAAFTLAENARQNSRTQSVSIEMFEKHNIVGGRVTTTQVFGQPELTIDTCAATIGFSSDTCILNLGMLTGLPTVTVTGLDNGTAIWNGEEIVGFTEDVGFRSLRTASSFKQARYRTRYGNAPLDSRITSVSLAFASLGTISFRSLSEVTSRINTTLMRSACEGNRLFCDGSAETDLFLREVIEAGVRDRFFGDSDELNELNAVIGTQDETNLFSISGGNLRLIERLISLSGARVSLDTKVKSLSLNDDGTWTLISSTGANKGVARKFDKVIIAAPLSLADLTIFPLAEEIPLVDYADTVVTHFTSHRRLNGDFFRTGLPVPQTVLTSATATRAGNKADLPFFSLRIIDNDIKSVNASSLEQGQNLYKMVSAKSIPDGEIVRYLEANDPNNRDKRPITWINREILPKSVPRLDRSLKIQDEIEIRPGLFYAGGGAQVTDTIEFGCRMGRNAARLIVPAPFRRGEPGNG